MNIKIEQWRKRKDEQADLHQRICKRFQKTKDKKLNQIANEIHDRVFHQIDCLECANCCKSIPPIVNETDVRRISKYLGIKITDFKSLYIIEDEDMDMVIKNSPCSFLENDNKCKIYEFRPKACREYPHTDNYEFLKNIRLHPINAKYCPGVFHILEDLSQIVK